jgi:hypothetical protein
MQETVCGMNLRAAQTCDGAIVSLEGSRPILISMTSTRTSSRASCHQSAWLAAHFGRT